MAYLLRFVQRFRPADEHVFMELERQFAALECQPGGMPRGRRYQPYSAREPRHTLIWQCEFPSIEEVNKALAGFAASQEHDRLFAEVAPTMIDTYTEIYEVLDM